MQMRALRRWLGLAVLLALTPGAGEVVENLGHLVVQGHFAHAEERGDDHSAPGSEHGCNGTFHLCSCHPTQTFLDPTASFLGRAPAPAEGPLATASLPLRAGFHHIPERPPRA